MSRQRTVDWLVLTARKFEWDAVCRRLAGPEDPPERMTSPAKLGRVGSYAVLCVLGGKGEGEAATSLQEAATKWKPRWVLLVGIAGGFRARGATRGNIVVAKYVYSGDYGKLTGGVFERQPDHDYKCDHGLLTYAELVPVEEGNRWTDSIAVTRPDGQPTSSSRVSLGYVVSSDKMIDDPEHDIFRAIRSAISGGVDAVEMEGTGAGNAIERLRSSSNRAIGFLMIRGISDEPDNTERGSAAREIWRSYAAEAAAAFAYALIAQVPAVVEVEPEPGPIGQQPYKLRLFGIDDKREEALRIISRFDGSRIVGFHGIGGVGKSVLAADVMFAARDGDHRIVDDYLFLSSSSDHSAVPGYDQRLTFAQILAALADHLRTEPTVNSVQRILARQRVLIVLDNLETSADPQRDIVRHVCNLVQGTKTCVLLTSREAFEDDRVEPMHLTGLESEPCYELIRYRGKDIPGIAEMEKTDLNKIVIVTGGIPLALNLVVRQLSTEKLERVINRLIDLDPQADDEYVRFYRRIIDWSWRESLRRAKAKGREEDVKSLIIALELFPSTPSGAADNAALLHDMELTEKEQRRLTFARELLLQLSLLEVVPPPTVGSEPRFYLHPMVHQYVRSAILELPE